MECTSDKLGLQRTSSRHGEAWFHPASRPWTDLGNPWSVPRIKLGLQRTSSRHGEAWFHPASRPWTDLGNPWSVPRIS